MPEPPPLYRPLRVFAFDPGLGRRHGNHMTLHVPYEDLERGPRGEMIEVVDFDASNQRYYEAVDLDDRNILLRDGLDPSEADPRFHQQMVYAVAAKTIDHFGAALGRRMAWRKRKVPDPRTGRTRSLDRPLRVFPHAFQDSNAYYDADRHALLFGYFASGAGDAPSTLAGQTVFTCLSHDIVAHETTHALLHDIRHYFMEPTGLDTLAFHEAFADVVALFQHFSVKEAVQDHVLRTGGALHRERLRPVAGGDEGRPASGRAAPAPILAEESQRNLLIGMAQQFGEAIGLRAALRSALERSPDPAELRRRTEPHERGAILVAAVFDAFFTVYSSRMADLRRIAGGSGWPGNAEVGHDLANRLAKEAAKTAGHFLNMCIRALDYCPPVDITFGDYLRALITADYDLVRDDDWGYREILIDAFRRRGIHPEGVTSQSESSLRWQPAETPNGRPISCDRLSFDVIHGNVGDVDRVNAVTLNRFAKRHARALRLDRRLPIHVRSFHPVHRVSPDGDLRFQVVVELVQSRELRRSDLGGGGTPRPKYRGGTTLVLDARSGRVEYAIHKPLGKQRLQRQLAFWGDWWAAGSTAFRSTSGSRLCANFSAVHRGF